MVEPIDPAVLARDRYADVEALLVDWLESALSALDVRARTILPEGDSLDAVLADCGGFIHVEAFGGNETGPEKEQVNIAVDTYMGPLSDGNAADVQCADLAAMIQAAMLFHLPGYYAGRATVQAVTTFARPSARPYDDGTLVSRRSAAYQVTVATRG